MNTIHLVTWHDAYGKQSIIAAFASIEGATRSSDTRATAFRIKLRRRYRDDTRMWHTEYEDRAGALVMTIDERELQA